MEKMDSGTVCSALPSVNTRANAKSFQIKRAHITAVVAMAGLHMGMTTRKKVPNTLHPSMVAASSTSMGRVTMKDHIIKKENGIR